MSTEKHYNMSQKLLYAESVQKGRIVRNAKRPKKSQNLLRRNTSHSLWWNVPNSMVLQKTQSQVDVAEPCTLSSTKQSLHNRRVAFSSASYHDSRSWALKFYQDIAIQWFFSEYSRVKKLSKRDYAAPFSFTAYSPSVKTDTFGSRPPSAEDAILSLYSYQCDIGLRYDYPNSIWSPRGSPQGIQPIQARSFIISSLSLLRSTYPRLPAREVSSWWRTRRTGKKKVHGRRLGQVAFLYIQDKGSGRLQVVRSRDTSSPRREKDWLYHRSQSQSAHPAYSWRASLSRVQEGLGGSRIRVSASPIYASPLHCGAKASAREERRPAYAVYSKGSCLPCDSYKPRASSRKRLEVLSGSSQNRVKYQRAEVGLLYFQDTHKEIFSKQGIFPSTFIRLQYNKLVQAAMSAGTVSICYVTNHSQRTISTASEAGKIRQQKLTAIAETLCLQLGVRLCN